MQMTIPEMQAALLEFEKAAPAIQRAIQVLPDLKRIVEIAQMFGQMSLGTANIGQNAAPELVLEAVHAEPGTEEGDGFTKTIMRIMKREKRRLRPRDVSKILKREGLYPENAPPNKVNFTMYYLGSRSHMLDGDGLKGYTVSQKGWGNKTA